MQIPLNCKENKTNEMSQHVNAFLYAQFGESCSLKTLSNYVVHLSRELSLNTPQKPKSMKSINKWFQENIHEIRKTLIFKNDENCESNATFHVEDKQPINKAYEAAEMYEMYQLDVCVF